CGAAAIGVLHGANSRKHGGGPAWPPQGACASSFIIKCFAAPFGAPPIMELAKSCEPHAIEAKWYPLWEESGWFKPSWAPGAAPYCIHLPPPNVTGTLHMGHGFQQTLMDTLVRYHRMRGDNTLWQVGTDHAGIATQIVVENQLQMQGQSRDDLGREAFIAT